MNEHNIVFDIKSGHTHDGENSAFVTIPGESIELRHLSPELLEYLEGFVGGGDTAPDATGVSVVNVDDLTFIVNDLAPGESVTGTAAWVKSAMVRFVRVESSEGALCDITFYHSPDFTNEEREFKATDCTNKFLWEGVWAHYDDTGSQNIYYKIENTGNVTSDFTVTLKSGTMSANGTGGGSSVGVKSVEIYGWSYNAVSDKYDTPNLFGRLGTPITNISGERVGFVETGQMGLLQIDTKYYFKVESTDPIAISVATTYNSPFTYGGTITTPFPTGFPETEFFMSNFVNLPLSGTETDLFKPNIAIFHDGTWYSEELPPCIVSFESGVTMILSKFGIDL